MVVGFDACCGREGYAAEGGGALDAEYIAVSMWLERCGSW